MEEILIKYLDNGEGKVLKVSQVEGSDWVDLRASVETVIESGEYVLIPLGVAMKLPDGYEAHIIPRSSTFKRYGILMANSYGMIDESYCGNTDQWHFPAYATRDTVIHKDDRICQFRIVRKQPFLLFKEVEELEGKSRGGFGSTGVK